MLGKDYEGQDCAIARALEVIGERWTLLIVRDAFFGVRRFSDFAAHLEVPRAVLTDRLRTLVDAGVLARRPESEHAGRSVYELTFSGRELWPVVHALAHWGVRLTPDAQARRRFTHATCGTELDEHAYCLSCQIRPEPVDVVTLHLDPPASRSDPVSIALREPRRLLDPV